MLSLVAVPERTGSVAAAILYLCSDEAAFTTGTVLVVDGGQTV